MRNINHLLSGLALACVGALLLAASAVAQEARILKIVGTGSATVTIAGQPRAAQESMSVPLNAEIATTTQEIYIEVVPGVVATVKPRSTVRVDTLEGPAPALELRQGSVVTQIDKQRVAGKTYSVKTARGVAAARGTSFTVSVSSSGFSIATTADRVVFTTPTGASVMIQAGMISMTPAGAATPSPAVPLASAAATNPEVASIVRDAVQTVATVVQNNLGQISAESATNLVSQVVAVAVAAVPSEAAAFTTQAVSAVTASGATTALTPEAAATAAGAVTASAVKSAPDQAGQIAGAAAQAAPAQSGVITAAAQQVAPQARDAITQQVATTTGQSATTVQNSANASAGQASAAVSASNNATSNIVAPSTPATPPVPQAPAPQTPPVTNQPSTTPPVDPTARPVSPSH